MKFELILHIQIIHNDTFRLTWIKYHNTNSHIFRKRCSHPMLDIGLNLTRYSSVE